MCGQESYQFHEGQKKLSGTRKTFTKAVLLVINAIFFKRRATHFSSTLDKWKYHGSL